MTPKQAEDRQDRADHLGESEKEKNFEEKMQNLKVCPNCGKTYEPDLLRQHPEKHLQHEFPNATPTQREQHISGICSDECWNQFLGEAE